MAELETRSAGRPGAGNPVGRRLVMATVVAAVAIRLVAAVALVAGPWTDDRSELAGWDIERFVAIAAEPGRAWRDHPVEYPPASVAVFEGLVRLAEPTTDPVVPAHRSLVVVATVTDLGLATALARRRRRAGIAYLLVGTPLVPMGLVRLDLLVTAVAGAAALVAVPRPSADDGRDGSAESTTGPPSSLPRPSPALRRSTVGVLTALAVMMKIWPGLLVPALWSVRRVGAAGMALGATAAAGGAWLWWAGSGLDPVEQVVSLRGATGWHLESLGGVVVSLADGAGLIDLAPDRSPRLEFGAFRTGTLIPWLVTAGRLVAVAAIVALAARGRRVNDSGVRDGLTVLATVMTGSVAVLIVTSPLISPQFLLWLTPWAALMVGDGDRRVPPPVVLTAAAAVVTGVVLTVFAPPDLARVPAAVGLAARNGLLLAIPISCWRWLGRVEGSSRR